MQKDAEIQWENLVRAMAPSCARLERNGLLTVQSLLDAAITAVAPEEGAACPTLAVSIPPHHETSLHSIAEDVDSLGS